MILITLTLSLGLAFKSPESRSSIDSNIKEAALVILQTQCNSCHKTQNPMRVFTADNMNGYAKKINRQVFVWKRMPKGNKHTLSMGQKETLKNWINNLNQ